MADWFEVLDLKSGDLCSFEIQGSNRTMTTPARFVPSSLWFNSSATGLPPASWDS